MDGVAQYLPFAAVALAAVVVLAAALILVRRRGRAPRQKIRVIGVGGAGCSTVDRMIRAKVRGAEFIACNTDAQALRQSKARHKVRIGAHVTNGLGTGGDPELGRRAAEDDASRIASTLRGSHLVFVTAGLGGGTGSGAAPIVAQIARELGALTVGVATMPFAFEGSRRRAVAEQALDELGERIDTIITVPNDGARLVVLDQASMLDVFRAIDDNLRHAIQGIVDTIVVPGLINLDFADIRAVMKDAGPALVGVGHGEGEHRTLKAARQAIENPQLGIDVSGARSVLLNVAGPPDLSIGEVSEAVESVRQAADPDAYIVVGANLRGSMEEEVQVTVIATGFVAQPHEGAAETGWAPRAEAEAPAAVSSDEPAAGVGDEASAAAAAAEPLPPAADVGPIAEAGPVAEAGPIADLTEPVAVAETAEPSTVEASPVAAAGAFGASEGLPVPAPEVVIPPRAARNRRAASSQVPPLFDDPGDGSGDGPARSDENVDVPAFMRRPRKVRTPED